MGEGEALKRARQNVISARGRLQRAKKRERERDCSHVSLLRRRRLGIVGFILELGEIPRRDPVKYLAVRRWLFF